MRKHLPWVKADLGGVVLPCHKLIPWPISIRRLARALAPIGLTSTCRRASFRWEESSTPAQNAPAIVARPAAALENGNLILLRRSPSRPHNFLIHCSYPWTPHI